MGKSIVLLVLGIFCFNVYADEPNAPPEDVNICDCNCVYNPDSNTCDCNCVCKPPEPLPVAYLYEDFNNTLLLNWIVAGNDSTHWSFTKVPGSLTIKTQKGTFERTATDYKNLFLLNFPVSPLLDFQVTTSISNYSPYGLWNQAGLVLMYDTDNFFKFIYEFGEGPPPNNAKKLLFTAAVEIGAYPVHGWFETEQSPQKMWLRIIKRGSFYYLYNSTDGKIFNPVKVILPARLTDDNTVPTPSFPLRYIGIFANNGGGTAAPEVDASFDFLEFKTLPPDPNTADE